MKNAFHPSPLRRQGPSCFNRARCGRKRDPRLRGDDGVKGTATRRSDLSRILHGTRPWHCALGAFASDNHAQHFVMSYVSCAGGAHNFAVFHHHNSVSEIKHVVKIMADEENANAFGFELFDELAHLGGFLWA